MFGPKEFTFDDDDDVSGGSLLRRSCPSSLQSTIDIFQIKITSHYPVEGRIHSPVSIILVPDRPALSKHLSNDNYQLEEDNNKIMITLPLLGPSCLLTWEQLTTVDGFCKSVHILPRL